MLVGVLSDTHGLLRPEVLPALAGVDHILHAGDVGDIAILEALRQIAQVTAIRGNVDTHGPCSLLPKNEAVELDGCFVYMVHALDRIDIHPKAAGVGMVVYGHSHKPSVERRDSIVYLNPGSAGPRRFSLQVTLARVRIVGGVAEVEMVELV